MEGSAGVFGSAGEADEVAEVAVEFCGGEGRVGEGVEGIYICRILLLAVAVLFS